MTKSSDGSQRIKLLDFGISKETSSASDAPQSLTKSGTILGSPMYMSPEQLTSSRDVDFRTDVWSLGTVLFELLTGEPPFPGTTIAELYSAILRDEPSALSDYRSDVDGRLVDLIYKCLEKDPELRYQSVGELAEALAPFAARSLRDSIERTRRISDSAADTERDPAMDDKPKSIAELPTATGSSPEAQPVRVGTTTSATSIPRRRPAKRTWLAISALLLAGVLIAAVVWLQFSPPPERVQRKDLSAPLPKGIAGGRSPRLPTNFERAEKTMPKFDEHLPKAVRKRLGAQLAAAKLELAAKHHKRARRRANKVIAALRKRGVFKGFHLSELACGATSVNAQLAENRIIERVSSFQKETDFPDHKTLRARLNELNARAIQVQRFCGPAGMACNMVRHAKTKYRIGLAFAKLAERPRLRVKAAQLALEVLMDAESSFAKARALATQSGRCLTELNAGIKAARAARDRL